MRQETTIRTIYNFDELTEDQQQLAIEDLQDINVDCDWWDYIYDDAKSIGLGITEFDLARTSYVRANFILSACEVAQNIINAHGETCDTYTTAQNFLDDWQPHFNAYIDETSDFYESQDIEQTMLDLEDEFLKALQEDYRIILRNEYNYLTSDEAIIETINANEYEFYATGKLI